MAAVKNAALPPFAESLHVTIIQGLNAPAYMPVAMNDWGEIVGLFVAPSGQGFQFKWQGSRGVTLDTTDVDCETTNVNNRGEISLSCLQGGVLQDWFGHDRTLRNLSTYVDPNNPFAPPQCDLSGVADNGAVMGTCSLADQLIHLPTGWTPFGTPYPFYASGKAIHGAGTAISHDGYMAGNDSTTGSGFIVTPTGQMRTLPPAGNSFVSVVNDSGWAAGELATPLPQSPGRTVAWLRGDSLVFLNRNAQPVGISNTGQIIMTSGLLWTPKHGLLQLPPVQSGANLDVIAINNSNQILGWTIVNGAQVHVIWTMPAGY